MPFVSSVRGTFGPQSENKGVGVGTAIAEIFRANPNAISGGTLTTAGGFRIHTFTDAGNSTFLNSTGITLNAEILVVAGGGGGGSQVGGGGGAGGLAYGSSISIPPGNFTATVGNFGQGCYPFSNNSYRVGSKGGDSVWSGSGTTNITAIGGGGGGGHGSGVEQVAPFSGQETQQGRNGGSGGGAGANSSSNLHGNATQGSASGYTGYGNRGGSSVVGGWFGGGGGGAGGVGGNASGGGGAGGAGLSFSISGSSNFYAAGGGGCYQDSGNSGRASGVGGVGVGNNDGNNLSRSARSGVANTGSGGGGSRDAEPGSADGAVGVIVVRYAV